MTTAPTDILKQLDDPEPGTTWFWSLASIVVFVVIIVAASAFYFKIDSFEIDAKIIDQPTLSLEQLRAGQREELAVYSNYSWILPDGKTATFTRIPIDRAMEMVIQDAKSAPRTLPVSSAPAVVPVSPAPTSAAQPGAKK